MVGFLPLSVRITAPTVSYRYARWIPSAGAPQPLAQRKPAKGERLQPACIPNRPNLFAERGDHRGLLSHLSKCRNRGPERPLSIPSSARARNVAGMLRSVRRSTMRMKHVTVAKERGIDVPSASIDTEKAHSIGRLSL